MGHVKSLKTKTYFFDGKKSGDQVSTPGNEPVSRDVNNFVEFFNNQNPAAVTTATADQFKKSVLREAEPNIVNVENSNNIKQ